MLDIVIDNDAIRIGPRCAVSLQRTLRIPDDGQTYPLPPGLGLFPILRAKNYQHCLPKELRDGGDAFIAMYQREALWLGFHGTSWKPNAVKVAVGGINALSGLADKSGLSDDPQDYMVVPTQPWLDGFNVGCSSIRQFVAMPLGMRYTVEASLTGEEKRGGIQITVFEPKPGKFSEVQPAQPDVGRKMMSMSNVASASPSMGLGAGGVMRQKIYQDPHGIDVWNQLDYGRVTIHILNSAQFHEITGEETPPTPIDAATYTEHNLPWFNLYDEEKRDIAPSALLSNSMSIAERDAERGTTEEGLASFNVPETQIKKLGNGEIPLADQS